MIQFFKKQKIKKLSKKFKEETRLYSSQVNAHREEGLKSKWQKKPSTPLPIDTRQKYADEIYKIILEFNQNNKIDELKHLFPPQTEIFYELTANKKTVSNIRKLIAIDENQYLVSIDEPVFSEKYNQWIFERNSYIYQNGNFSILEGVLDFGVCPNKKIFACVQHDKLILTKGWKGDVINQIDLSISEVYFPDESLVGSFPISSFLGGICIPFSDGKKILLGGEDSGLILKDKNKNVLILPDKTCFSDYQRNDDKDKKEHFFGFGDFPMLHCSLSHNNKYIAFGYQCSEHNLCNVKGLTLSEIAPLSSYPHYSLFSKNDEQVMFNSCHFYSGETLGIRVSDVLNAQTAKDKITELDLESRVYAAVSTSFGYIIGDANGYIRARSHKGEYLWEDFLGFNINTMDITVDEKFLYVGTYKGIIYKVQLNYGERDPYQIGNSNNQEICRWMFWEKGKVLRW